VQIRPDILISTGGHAAAVADVKYKRVGERGVSPNDVYQALAYASRYGLAECTLIYPEAPRVDRLEVGGVTIRLAEVRIDVPPAARDAAIRQLADRMVLNNPSQRHVAFTGELK